ncbi:hypothetical protein [Marimonas lutisalis]|uniref:hypothetical protein n=1 Tax=Marimonas lutisalis TaxID=2545756 RepID=UPI0010F44292|nr:hypothetical protein [Marimonas lutisalis]
MREEQILRSVAPFYEEIERLGYDVRASTDFDEIQRLVAKTGRAKQTPMMSIPRNDFTSQRAFWLFLYKDGEVVGGIAAKYDQLGEESFSSYMRRTSREQYGRDTDPIERIAKPVEDLIGGNVVYIGELEFHPDHRGRLILLEAVGKVMQGLAAVKWSDFDWMYAIIPEEHLKFDHIYGFTLTVPDAFTWTAPEPPGRLNTHALLAVEGRHLEHLMVSAAARLRRNRSRADARKRA